MAWTQAINTLEEYTKYSSAKSNRHRAQRMTLCSLHVLACGLGGMVALPQLPRPGIRNASSASPTQV